MSCRLSIPGQRDREGGTQSKAVDSALKMGHRLCQQKHLLTNAFLCDEFPSEMKYNMETVACGNDIQIGSLML